MNMQLTFKASLLATSLLMTPFAYAAAMSKADYKTTKTTVAATYKADKAACAPMKDNAKDICVLEAKGKEKVALAELEYAYTGKAADQNKLLVARADSAYAVGKEKCDDMKGNDKDVCVKEAKAVHVKALADAKMGKEIGAAKKDAADDKRDADYKVAAEKCDALAGDAKTSCLTTAKARFGKS